MTMRAAWLLTGVLVCGACDRPAPRAPVSGAPGAAWTVTAGTGGAVTSMPSSLWPIAAFADGDLVALDLEGEPTTIQRVDRRGRGRWTATWPGGLQVGNAYADERGVWVVGAARAPAPAGVVPPEPTAGPLVVARFDGETGAVATTAIIDDADIGVASVRPLGADLLVVGSRGSGGVAPVRVWRFSPDLRVVAEARGLASWVPFIDVEGDAVCIGSERAGAGELTTRELWCLDARLRDVSRRPVDLATESLWLRGGAVDAEMVATGRYRYELRVGGRPPLALVARCRDGDDDRDRSSFAPCEPRAVRVYGGASGARRSHIVMASAGDLEVGGTALGLRSPAVVLVTFDHEGRVEYRAHPGCDWGGDLGRGRVAMRCGPLFEVVSLDE